MCSARCTRKGPTLGGGLPPLGARAFLAAVPRRRACTRCRVRLATLTTARRACLTSPFTDSTAMADPSSGLDGYDGGGPVHPAEATRFPPAVSASAKVATSRHHRIAVRHTTQRRCRLNVYMPSSAHVIVLHTARAIWAQALRAMHRLRLLQGLRPKWLRYYPLPRLGEQQWPS